MKTVKKALAILETFSQEVQYQGVTEIAKKLNLHKSSAFSFLKTLKEEGYLVYDSRLKKYSLGFKLIELAGRILYKRDLRDISIPIMKELAEAINEDVALNILIEGKRVCIALVESQYFVRQFVPIGKALPLHCSAAGKALLAFLPQQEIDNIVAKHGLPKFTSNTITQKTKLVKELEEIRKNGYAESREEYGKEAASIAFPIFNNKGEIIASLSIQSTINRLTKKTLPEFLKHGFKASQRINAILASSPNQTKEVYKNE